MYRKVFTFLFLLITTFLGYGQSNILNANNPTEIGKKNIDQIQSDLDSYLEYEYIDDRDILWSKIVYEKIDLSERLNFPLLFPIDDNLYVDTRKSLWRVLKENIIDKNITLIYNANNDNFKELLTYEQAMSSLKISKNYGDENDPDFQTIEITSADITGYYLKGMWYFDKRRGELMYRLLAIMPVGKNIEDPFDEEMKTTYFWIWYPSIRKILHKELVFNDTSNANQISFDQLLISRRFSSYIYKEDNIYGDRPISAYKLKGLESILESQRIKKEILDFEQDLWNR
ncbi:MAG: gliding motility protein GldN [Flavobacteriaceae bacterium]|nr:gliding motility protein GldN [Flavobacteriaceae bacterium]